MNVLLERGIIPIINENDTVTVNRLKFGDNDTLAAKVAGLIDADMLVILSDIDGLYDGNPRTNPEAKKIQRVSEITPDIEACAGDTGSIVGTGGMRSKLASKMRAVSLKSLLNSFFLLSSYALLLLSLTTLCTKYSIFFYCFPSLY